MARYCGGCSGEGRHWRWCPNVVGVAASHLGQLAEEAEGLGDRIGANNAGAANMAYATSGVLREDARRRAEEFMHEHGTRH